MSITKTIIKNLSKVENNLGKIAAKAIKENEEEILDLIKDDQLGKGFDAFGKNLTHPQGNSDGTYAESTEFFWSKQSPKPRTPKITGRKYDMEWTGKTKDSMKIKTLIDGFDVLSATKNAIEAIYGAPMIKLSKEHLELVNEKYVSPPIYEAIFASLNPFK